MNLVIEGSVQPSRPSLVIDSPQSEMNPTVGPTAASYTQKDQRQHVYDVPDMYVGSEMMMERSEWLYSFESGRMVLQIITLPQAVERLFLEIISNASDNVGNSRRVHVNPGRIGIRMDKTTITVRNGGLPIPVEIKPENGLWVPQMIFGTLLTSSNYDVVRHGIGRNGIGAKACNIFSLYFRVMVADSFRRKLYTQVWRENMKICEDPIIQEYLGTESWVEITYTMDFARFGYTEYPPEAFALFARHAADISFTGKVGVDFSCPGNNLNFNHGSIREYGRLYFGDAVNGGLVYYQWPEGTVVQKKARGYQVAEDGFSVPTLELLAVDTPDSNNPSVSFVNSLMTKDGGVHVEACLKAVASNVIQKVNETRKGKKGSKKDVSRSMLINISDVRPHISILVSYRVPNPGWGSQSKNMLMSPAPKISFTEEELKIVDSWELLNRLYAALDAKLFRVLQKSESRRRGRPYNPKCDDANEAGGVRSGECSLWLMEGDSAKQYAKVLVGLIPQGRDFIGLLPLRGKGLNVMNAKLERYLKNTEITAIRNSLGLREGVDYRVEENFRTLNYGSVTILADSDDDGKHIIGLITLFFYCRYPSLLARGYVRYLRTPIIRAKRGKEKAKFYTMREFTTWLNSNPEHKLWSLDYLKGLGTSEAKDVKEDYSSNRLVQTYFDEKAPDSFHLAFDKTKTDERKDWIRKWDPSVDVEQVSVQPLSWFLNHEFILFSIANVQRSVPRMMDGLKISQRKVLWVVLNKFKVTLGKTKYKPMKVAQLKGKVSNKSNYHHGEDVLSKVIIGMAQDFVGSNNLPYLYPKGMFGTRDEGGKDASADRYIHTYPQWWLPYVFRPEDTPILVPTMDEGKEYEPVTFLPIIPMVLVNGANGIGTGWATFVPNHNPLDIVLWLKQRIQMGELPPVEPWYRGFTGNIIIVDRNRPRGRKSSSSAISLIPGTSEPEITETLGETEIDRSLEQDVEEEDEEEEGPRDVPRVSMVTQGVYRTDHRGRVYITELPIGRWSKPYWHWLEQLRTREGLKRGEKLKNGHKITYTRSLSDDTKVHFEVEGFGTLTHQAMGLQKSYGLTNMVLLDSHGAPQRFNDTQEILETFYNERLPMYEKRRQHIMEVIGKELKELSQKALLFRLLHDRTIVIENRNAHQVRAEMESHGIPGEFLNQIRLVSHTKEKLESLQKKIQKKEEELQKYQSLTAAQLWMADLEEFSQKYRSYYPEEIQREKKFGLSQEVFLPITSLAPPKLVIEGFSFGQ